MATPRIDSTSVSVTLSTLAEIFESAAQDHCAVRFPRDLVSHYALALRKVYHHALHLEMRAATADELEAVAADLDLVAFAKTGEIGTGEIGMIPVSDGRPQIELTAAGFEALSRDTFGESGEHVLPAPVSKPRHGVGPLCGQVVDAGAAFERRRLESLQRRLQAALDAGDEEEVGRLLASADKTAARACIGMMSSFPTGGGVA